MSNNLSNYSKERWDEAIADAEAEVRALAKQAARLRQAIRIFKENKREGVKWPGAGVIGQDG
jgi:hypothetical protein